MSFSLTAAHWGDANQIWVTLRTDECQCKVQLVFCEMSYRRVQLTMHSVLVWDDTHNYKTVIWAPQIEVLAVPLWKAKSDRQVVTAQSCHHISHISFLMTQRPARPRLLHIFQPSLKFWLNSFKHCLCTVSPGRLTLCPSLTGCFAVCKLWNLHFLSVLPGIMKYSHKSLNKIFVWVTQRGLWLIPAGSWYFSKKGKKRKTKGRRVGI